MHSEQSLFPGELAYEEYEDQRVEGKHRGRRGGGGEGPEISVKNSRVLQLFNSGRKFGNKRR